MKILVVSSYLPYPLRSGGHIRLYNLLKLLSKDHDITLICEKRNYQSTADEKEVEKICKKLITVERKKQWSFSNILKTGFSTKPFLIVGHSLCEMTEKISREIENEKYDLIHVETSYVMQNLPKTSLPVVLVEHNIEYKVYKRFADKAKFPLRQLFLMDVNKLRRLEESFWKKATKLVAVSETEKALMGRDDTVVVPNGVDVDNYKFNNKKENKEKTVLFIGDFKWIQNINTAAWILKEIWPLIEERVDAKLWIVGKNIPDSIKSFKRENIVIDENAPGDTRLIYEKSDILLSPIKVGGGTSYKILESMASGVAVVTTDLGVEGIGAKDKVHALVGTNSKDLAENVLRLLNDASLREELTVNARKLIEEKYDWKKIVKVLESVYKSAL